MPCSAGRWCACPGQLEPAGHQAAKPGLPRLPAHRSPCTLLPCASCAAAGAGCEAGEPAHPEPAGGWLRPGCEGRAGEPPPLLLIVVLLPLPLLVAMLPLAVAPMLLLPLVLMLLLLPAQHWLQQADRQMGLNADQRWRGVRVMCLLPAASSPSRAGAAVQGRDRAQPRAPRHHARHQGGSGVQGECPWINVSGCPGGWNPAFAVAGG